MTRADFLRVQAEARKTMAELRKIFPGAFDKNGRAIVAVAAFPKIGSRPVATAESDADSAADEAWNCAAAHAQGLRDRIAELEAQLAGAQEMNRKLVPRVSVANSRPLAEIVAEFENSSPENKARLLAARESALEAQRQWQWHPIETAPRDGRKVILFYHNRNSLARTVMARWVTDEQAAETDADDVGLEAGWYECIDNWDDYCQVCIHEGEPTHWMPLPPPPIERAHGIEEVKR